MRLLMIATNGGRITMHPLLEHIQVESSCVCWGAVTPMLWFAWPDPWVRHTTLYQTSPRTAQHIRLTCELHIHCCKADCTHNTSFTERDSRLCMCDRSAEFQPCNHVTEPWPNSSWHCNVYNYDIHFFVLPAWPTQRVPVLCEWRGVSVAHTKQVSRTLDRGVSVISFKGGVVI